MKADKGGNCAVIMDKKNYDDKIMHLLNDRNVYQIPVGDKSIKVTEKKVNKLVYGFAKKNKITTLVYHHLKSDKSVTPKFYGLPKIYKSDVQLRLLYLLLVLLLNA